jgi:hypothetical protein
MNNIDRHINISINNIVSGNKIKNSFKEDDYEINKKNSS